MRFVSLFAGVGGFDLGFERAGMTCAGQVELDVHCRKVLATHWPEVPRWEDIHEVTGERLGPVDVLVGGFPCQDYSVAGLRGGLAGDRGALWWQFHRLIAELRPTWVVGENVPGLLSSSDGRDFGAIVGSLVELGYGVVWRVLDAQYFGVAQRRRRVLIVGHIGGVPRPEVLDLAEGCAWDTPPRRQPGERPAPTLAARTKAGGGLGTDTDLDGGLIASALDTRPGDRQRPEGLVSYLPDTAGSLRQTDHKAPKIDIAEPSLIAFNRQSGGDVRLSAREAYTDALHAGQTPAVMSVREDQWTGAVYEMPYISALANGGGKPGQGYQAVREGASVRRLTPLECERLQGFPDNWTAGQKDTQRYRQMGNAVAVPVAEWVGRRIIDL